VPLTASAVKQLIDSGLLAESDLERARLAAEAMSTPVHSALVGLGLVAEDAMARTLADSQSLPLVADNDYPDEAVLPDLLSESFLRTCQVLPLSANEHTVTVALADPLDRDTIRALEMRLDRSVRPAVATPSQLRRHFDRIYGEAAGRQGTGPGEEGRVYIERLQDQVSDAPTVKLANRLIEQAVMQRASDIHLEPDGDDLRVRFRIDGLLREIRRLPLSDHAPLISRIKIMSGLDIVERRLPQDGRTQQVVEGRRIDMRVSCLPMMHGEGMVIRLLDQNRAPLELADLGLDSDLQGRLAAALDGGRGIALVTGPTGSGKTTTLYAALQRFNDPQNKIITVEDPVEFQLPGISQIQVRPEIGLGFSRVLRSVLRHDPDTLMIGEIRDLETAEIAVQAALTGHLVLSTLHTNSAPDALTRLADMGLDPYRITASVAAVVAQRLVRTLCEHCRTPAPDDVNGTDDVGGGATVYEAAGCERCGGTGYNGRTLIAEVMVIDEPLRSLIMQRGEPRAIEKAARAGGLLPMRQNGLDKVAQGKTSIAELMRVLGSG